MAGTVTLSAGTSGNPTWISILGSLQNIVDELQNQNLTASNIASITHDGTNFVVLCCRQG